MRKSAFGILASLLFSFMGTGLLSAAELGAAAPQAEPIDKNRVEGWIVRIDYRDNNFRLLDPRGFERYVKVKPGVIGDYRMGDKVRVQIDPDYKRASLIEKIY